MSAILNHLEKLGALKETNLGNLGLIGSVSSDDSITLSGVVKDEHGEIIFIDHDGSESRLLTVEKTSGFQKFAFEIDDQFPIVADSLNDTITFAGTEGIKVTTDPSVDKIEFGIDAAAIWKTVGTGVPILNADADQRTFLGSKNLAVVGLPEEVQFSVDLTAVNVGSGDAELYVGLDADEKPKFRSLVSTPTVRVEEALETITFKAIPNLADWGVGESLFKIENEIGKFRTVQAVENVTIYPMSTGEIQIQSFQNYAHQGIGFQLVSTNNKTWEIRTLKAGSRTNITDLGDGTLVFSSNTELQNTGTGAPLSRNESGVGKVRSIKAGLGVEVTQNPDDVEIKANTRLTQSGDGTGLGSIQADGSLLLKKIKAYNDSILLHEQNGNLEIQANPDDYLLDAKVGDSLDGTEPIHLILTNNRNEVIDAGPLPYLHAELINGEIHILNRNSLVGKIPPDSPDDPMLKDLDTDYQTADDFGLWDFSVDLAEPRDRILYFDLEA